MTHTLLRQPLNVWAKSHYWCNTNADGDTHGALISAPEVRCSADGCTTTTELKLLGNHLSTSCKTREMSTSATETDGDQQTSSLLTPTRAEWTYTMFHDITATGPAGRTAVQSAIKVSRELWGLNHLFSVYFIATTFIYSWARSRSCWSWLP